MKYSQVNLDVDILFLVLCTPSSEVKLKRIMNILPCKLLNANTMSHELLPLAMILTTFEWIKAKRLIKKRTRNVIFYIQNHKDF